MLNENKYINMKRIVVYLLLAIVAFSVNAQIPEGLTKETVEEVNVQAKLKVDEFNDHLSFIASKKNKQGEVIPSKAKDAHVTEALKLFLGQGESYYDQYGNLKPAPTMEVSSINRKTKEERRSKSPIKTYLNRMKEISYSEVKVTASNACFVSDWKKVDDDTYEAVMTYVQIFEGKRVNKYNETYVAYIDVTKKTITLTLKRKQYGDIVRWQIFLGDISVKATE